MADELNENSEYSKKKKNEEEPILVAQRYLNIFHQIHIFNQARKDQFDQMLLELKPEIRVLLSTLPGGSILQEHIEELELKKGMMDEEELEQNSEKRKKDTRDLFTKSNKTPTSANGAIIGLDPSFATTLASSLGKALQQSEQRHREEIQALTKSIAESQAGMMAMFREILGARGREAFGETILSTSPDETENTPSQKVSAKYSEKTSEKQKQLLDKLTKSLLKTSTSKSETSAGASVKRVAEIPSEPAGNVSSASEISESTPENFSEAAVETALEAFMESTSAHSTENVDTSNLPEPESSASQDEFLESLPPEIEKIRQALTTEQTAIHSDGENSFESSANPQSSFQEETLSLDDITPVLLDDNLESTLQESSQEALDQPPKETSSDRNDDDWEWEYVEEGSKNNAESNEDWEWAYVEDNNSSGNNQK